MGKGPIHMGRHLNQTADITRCDHPHPEIFEMPRLACAELSGQFGLKQVIGASRAATQMSLIGFNNFKPGVLQKRHRFGRDLLAVAQGTGGQITHPQPVYRRNRRPLKTNLSHDFADIAGQSRYCGGAPGPLGIAA